MKKLIFTSLIIAFLFTIYACQNKKGSTENQQQTEVAKTEVDITVTMKGTPDILTKATDTIQVSIVNNTSSEVTTGEYYDIEKYEEKTDNAGWQKIPLELAFIDIAYILQPGDSRDFKITLHPESYGYEPGRYRVSKKAYTEEKNYELFFNFELKP
jgi:uncharacterized protein YcfL